MMNAKKGSHGIAFSNPWKAGYQKKGYWMEQTG
jgi:hypothetical protein